MNIQKDRLPKGLSYPVRSSTIAAVLENAGVTLDCTVNYQNNLASGFAAHFWPSNPNIAYERVYLTIGAVSAEDAPNTRQRMSETVLPQFVSWLLALLALPANSPVRREQQMFQRGFFG